MQDFDPNLVNVTIAIISIIGTFIATYLTIGKSKKVTLLREQIIDVQRDVIKRVSVLDVYFKESPIKDNTYLINGVLWNSGDIDISESDIKKPITIEIPGATILDANITDTNDDLTAEILNKSETSVSFHFQAFRKNEYIKFYIISHFGKSVDLKEISKDKIWNKLNISHRIMDLGEIIKDQFNRDHKVDMMSSLLMIFFGLYIFFLLVVVNINPQRDLMFIYKPDGANQDNIIVSAQASNGEIKLRSKENDIELYETPDNFLKKIVRISIVPKQFGKSYRIAIIIFVILAVLLLILGCVLLYKALIKRSLHRAMRKISLRN